MAAFIAKAPSFGAVILDSDPPKLPMGVRTAEIIKDCCTNMLVYENYATYQAFFLYPNIAKYNTNPYKGIIMEYAV